MKVRLYDSLCECAGAGLNYEHSTTHLLSPQFASLLDYYLHPLYYRLIDTLYSIYLFEVSYYL